MTATIEQIELLCLKGLDRVNRNERAGAWHSTTAAAQRAVYNEILEAIRK